MIVTVHDGKMKPSVLSPISIRETWNRSTVDSYRLFVLMDLPSRAI